MVETATKFKRCFFFSLLIEAQNKLGCVKKAYL